MTLDNLKDASRGYLKAESPTVMFSITLSFDTDSLPAQSTIKIKVRRDHIFMCTYHTCLAGMFFCLAINIYSCTFFWQAVNPSSKPTSAVPPPSLSAAAAPAMHRTKLPINGDARKRTDTDIYQRGCKDADCLEVAVVSCSHCDAIWCDTCFDTHVCLSGESSGEFSIKKRKSPSVLDTSKPENARKKVIIDGISRTSVHLVLNLVLYMCFWGRRTIPHPKGRRIFRARLRRELKSQVRFMVMSEGLTSSMYIALARAIVEFASVACTRSSLTSFTIDPRRHAAHRCCALGKGLHIKQRRSYALPGWQGRATSARST